MINSAEHIDVCIVGAGPAGLTAALALGAAGRRVVLLESGGLRSSSRAQQLNDGEHEGIPYDGLVQTRHRQVGGTVNVWNVPLPSGFGAKYVPLSAVDMADWPFDYAAMEPYYIEAQALCGLGPFQYGADYWSSPSCRPFRTQGTGLTSGVYQFGPAEQFSRVLVNRLREAEAVTLVPSTTVVELIAPPRARRLLGVRAVGAGDRAFELRARMVILACGAIENARLLLLTASGRHPASPWLGRGFMEHARDFSMVLVPDSTQLFDEASFYDLHAGNDGTLVGGRVALSDEAIHSLHLPNASMTLVPRRRTSRGSGMLKRLSRSIRRASGMSWEGRYGWSRLPSPARTFDAFNIVLNLEHAPHARNRIELGGRSDRFGNSLPRLVLRWSEPEQQRLERLRLLLAGWFREAGLGRLMITAGRRPDMNAHHHAGTTRMGRGAEDGVVDLHGRVFAFDNLYLAGASVFPSAGFANPTLTTVALALRLAREVDAALD